MPAHQSSSTSTNSIVPSCPSSPMLSNSSMSTTSTHSSAHEPAPAYLQIEACKWSQQWVCTQPISSNADTVEHGIVTSHRLLSLPPCLVILLPTTAARCTWPYPPQ